METSETVPLPDETYLLALGDTTGFRQGDDSPKTPNDTRDNEQMTPLSSDDESESLISMRDIIYQYGLLDGPDAVRRFENEEGDVGNGNGSGNGGDETRSASATTSTSTSSMSAVSEVIDLIESPSPPPPSRPSSRPPAGPPTYEEATRVVDRLEALHYITALQEEVNVIEVDNMKLEERVQHLERENDDYLSQYLDLQKQFEAMSMDKMKQDEEIANLRLQNEKTADQAAVINANAEAMMRVIKGYEEHAIKE